MDDSSDDDDEQEQSETGIEKDSMSGLIMGFKPPVKGEKRKKKPPPLPPRGDISEDSMEDQISELESAPMSTKGMNEKQQSKRTIDVETILKQAAEKEGLDDSSIASSTY